MSPRASQRSGDGHEPPHDLPAEESVIGAVLLSPEAFSEVLATGLTAAEFFCPAHQHIFGAVLALHRQSGPVDTITVAHELRRAGLLDEVGGLEELHRLQNATPSLSNSGQHARIVARHAWRRRRILAAADVTAAAYEDDDAKHQRAIEDLATGWRCATGRSGALTAGGDFLFQGSNDMTTLWGDRSHMLWAAGQSLLIVGPGGVGKTSLAGQLLRGRLGFADRVLGLPVTSGRRVLYLACDRPEQIKGVWRRNFTDEEQDSLNERLVVHRGPPPADFAVQPRTLLELCEQAAADTVFIDSLKDVAIGLAKDEVGAGLNMALQLALANGVEVVGLHHQRKAGSDGKQPRKLDDVYGSTWITAGAGSVVLLWGEAGDDVVDMRHLKPLVEEVGPWKVAHDHRAGTSSVIEGNLTPLSVLCAQANGMTASELVDVMWPDTKAEDRVKVRRRAKRKLDQLCDDGKAHRESGVTTAAGRQEDRYYAATARDELIPQLIADAFPGSQWMPAAEEEQP